MLSEGFTQHLVSGPGACLGEQHSGDVAKQTAQNQLVVPLSTSGQTRFRNERIIQHGLNAYFQARGGQQSR